jgi:hypothetical protein
MNPFEDLIRELGQKIGLTIIPGNNQSCRLKVSKELFVQIDLDANGDKILIGAELGPLVQGSYRDAVLKQAMCVNGTSILPRGVLAFSEKNNSLVLFQFFSLAYIDAEKLFRFLKLFIAHARAWISSIAHQELPEIAKEATL